VGSYDINRLNLNRGDLGRPTYDPNTKSLNFRDASVFGETVCLPEGASGYWIKKAPGRAFNGKIGTIATALLEASSPDATRGRLARAMKDTQEKQGLRLEPINGGDGLTSVAIPQHFAFWLQADIPDLCFDWNLMQRQCSDMWKAIIPRWRRIRTGTRLFRNGNSRPNTRRMQLSLRPQSKTCILDGWI
jgi:hypothetical protein